MRIDLNADVGEMDPDLDARILDAVSSVNIACGGHAGNSATMREVATMAADRGVRIGAHPSYVDRDNFGRERLRVTTDTLINQLRDQIGLLQANSPDPVQYVKPHGALYHAAATDPDVAQAVVKACDGLALMGQPHAIYLDYGRAEGLVTITEGFADRAYTDAGHLLPRSEPGSVLHDEQAVLVQVADLARGYVTTVSGRTIQVAARSVCVHSDTPGAADLAHRIAGHLRDHGIEITA